MPSGYRYDGRWCYDQAEEVVYDGSWFYDGSRDYSGWNPKEGTIYDTVLIEVFYDGSWKYDGTRDYSGWREVPADYILDPDMDEEERVSAVKMKFPEIVDTIIAEYDFDLNILSPLYYNDDCYYDGTKYYAEAIDV